MLSSISKESIYNWKDTERTLPASISLLLETCTGWLPTEAKESKEPTSRGQRMNQVDGEASAISSTRIIIPGSGKSSGASKVTSHQLPHPRQTGPSSILISKTKMDQHHDGES